LDALEHEVTFESSSGTNGEEWEDDNLFTVPSLKIITHLVYQELEIWLEYGKPLFCFISRGGRLPIAKTPLKELSSTGRNCNYFCTVSEFCPWGWQR
jgi:hypothetical protein